MDGRKDDNGKPRMDLIPAKPIIEVGKALAYGADRYGDDNWRSVPNARNRYFAAAQRHMWQWFAGDTNDTGPDNSGLHHLAHAIACLLFLMAFDMGLDKENS